MNSTLLLLTIQNELERVFVGRRIPPLRRAHLWLGVKPHQDLSQGVWDARRLTGEGGSTVGQMDAYGVEATSETQKWRRRDSEIDN
jgi:hypothetical protein